MSPVRDFLCIGHRGARGHAPENTLLAIDKGVQLGADMIELDVQRCGDQLVVIHDPRLERCTNGEGRVGEVSFDYLRSLDAGQGQQIPVLAEALAQLHGKLPVNLEIKSADGTARLLAQALQQALANGWTAEQLLVSSFHLPELQTFKEALPQIPIAALTCGVPLGLASEAAALQACALNIAAEFADERLIADAHDRGLLVYAYTVNHPQDMRRLRQMGVDGVFSDFPERVLAIRDS